MLDTNVSCFYQVIKSTLRSGTIFGTAVLSQLSDLYGRRFVFVTSIWLSALLEMSSSITYEYWLLLLLRFVCGFFMAGAIGIGSIYVSELLTWRQRPIAVLFSNLLWSVSI